MLMRWFVDHLDSQVLGHKWGGISSPSLSLPRSPPYNPWHGTLGCVQCSMCYACSLHRGQNWTMRGEGDGLSPLLILCSLTGNSLAAGAELLNQKAPVESGPRLLARGGGEWKALGATTSHPCWIFTSHCTGNSFICSFLHEFRSNRSPVEGG